MLAAVMTLGTVNIAFADSNNNIPDVSYVQEEESEIIPMMTRVAYPVEGGNIYFDKDTGTILNADEGIITANIPDKIDGVAVTSIYDTAFAFTNITSVTIPDSVTNIESTMFNACLSLKNIYVSENNKNYVTIDGALYTKDKSEIVCCPGGKTDVVIPNGVKTIGERAFNRCENLTNVTIPNSVTSIKESAFNWCRNLKNITIPDSVTYIGVCQVLTNKFFNN